MAYIYNLADQWNDAGTTFNGIRLNVTDTASAAASNLLDLRVGGTSAFSINKSARASFGSASFRLGAADAASPAAQTFSVQNVLAGTTNTAGANLTIAGSRGTGTGAGGSILFQVAPAGSTGSTQNALATALTILPNGLVDVTYSTITGGIVFGQYGRLDAFGWYLQNTNGYIGWGPTSGSISSDVRLYRDAANTLAQRNGTNAQAFRLYNTFTDASNYERGFMRWSSNVLEIGAEAAGTGSARGILMTSPAHITFTHASGNYIQFKNGSNNVLTLFNASTVFATNPVEFGTLYTEYSERPSAPGAPSADRVRIYAEDDGAGKTRLMARFATGAAVQIAIEP